MQQINKLYAGAWLGLALALSACGSAENTEAEAETNAELPGGSVDASTSLGAGDTTSSAGAGATTGAMDGGSVVQDGDAVTNTMGDEDAGAGGPADRLDQAGSEIDGAAPTPAD